MLTCGMTETTCAQILPLKFKTNIKNLCNWQSQPKLLIEYLFTRCVLPSLYNDGNRPSGEITTGPIGKVFPSYKHSKCFPLSTSVFIIFTHRTTKEATSENKVHINLTLLHSIEVSISSLDFTQSHKCCSI